jgi:hypothetical protein
LSRFKPVWTHSFMSNILAQRWQQNGTDVTEKFLSVWTSPFNYMWENFTEQWCSATETWRIVWISPKSVDVGVWCAYLKIFVMTEDL